MSLDHLFTPALVQKYLDSLRLQSTSTATIKRKLSALSTFKKFLAKNNHLQSPSNSLPQPQPPKPSFSFPKIFNRYTLISLVLIIFLGLGYGLYTQTILKAQKNLAYSTASSPVRPGRILSFQGRLTDSSGNPVSSATPIVFKFFNSGTGGTELYASSTGNSQTVIPDANGIFSVVIGKSHGDTIPTTVFSENAEVWLEITADSETMDPRQPIASVAYALNSDTLQGLPPSASGFKNTVLVIDGSGNLNLGETSPTIKSTSGTLGVEGQAILIKASDSSGGNISINPDANGIIKLLTEGSGSTAVGGFIEATNANLATGNLYSGQINNTNRGYNFLNFQNYNTGTTQLATRFNVDASGNVSIGGTLNIANSPVGTGTSMIYIDSSGNLIKGGLPAGTVYTASNGISLSGNDFRLGGTLSQNTSINNSDYNLTFFDKNNTQSLLIGSSGYVGIGTSGNSPAGLNTSLGAKLIVNSSGLNNGGLVVGIGGTSEALYLFSDPTNNYAGIQVKRPTVSNDTLYLQPQGGSIGIGSTSTASEKLSIFTGNVRVDDNYGYYFGDGSSRILGNGTTDSITLVTGNQNRLFINSSGNIGLGITNPETRLHVLASTNNEWTTKIINNGGAGQGLYVGAGTTGGTQPIFQVGDYAETNKWFTILETGYVGIGTTDPQANLHLSNNYGYLRFGDNNSVVNTTNAGLLFYSDYSNAEAGRVGFFGDGLLTLQNTNTNHHIALLTSGYGYVGIGTTSPLGALDISSGSNTLTLGADNNATTRTDGTNKVARILVPNRLNSEESTMLLYSTGSTVGFGGGSGAANAATQLRFYTAANDTTLNGNEAMRINSNGYVGIGTTDPQSTLHVNGSFSLTNTAVGTGTSILYIDSSGVVSKGALPAGTVYTASNGITLATNDFQLGGSLTQLTKINLNNYNFGLYGTGNFGVGTTNPQHTLQTYGTLKVGGAAAQTTGNIVLGDDQSTSMNVGMFRGTLNGAVGGGNVLNLSGYDGINLTAGNAAFGSQTKVLTVTSTGRVGIGTTSPSQKLEVIGSLNVRGASANGDFSVMSADGTSGYWDFAVIQSTGEFQMYDAINAKTPFRIEKNSPSNSFYIDSTGYIGIGTSNPAYQLDLTGSLRVGTTFVSVGSTNLVTNLNANYLNGYASSNLPYVNDVTNSTLVRSGSGPYTLALNLGSTNTWTAPTTFSNNLTIGGTLTISNSPLGTGTSLLYIDSSGVVSKGALPAGTVYTASNGVTLVSNDFQLGGNLIQNTQIGTSSFNLAFTSLGGTQAFSINSNGNIGIGLTSASNKLTITGNSSSRIRASIANTNATSKSGALSLGSGGATTAWELGGDYNLNGSDNFYIYGGGAGAPRLFINSTGQIGIGTTNQNYALTIGSTSAGAMNFNPALLTIGSNNDGYEFTLAAGIPDYTNMGGSIRIGGSTRGDGDVNVIQFSQNGTERMRIHNGGNVGIGATTPTAKLHVKSAGGADSGIKLEITNANSYGTIDFTTPAGLSGQFLATGVGYTNGMFTGDQVALANYLSNGLISLVAGGANSYINFATGGYAKSNERMRLTSTGYLGLGTTTPSYQLDMTGSLRVGATFVSVGSTNLVTNLNADLFDGYHLSFLPFVDNATDTTLTRSGSGPYTLALNLGSTNTWTAPTTFSNNLTIGGTFISVGSTNLVTNLNANYLNGYAYDNLPYMGAISFYNGIVGTGSTYGLGGSLSIGTSIDQNNYNFSFLGSGNFGIGLTNPLFRLSSSGIQSNYTFNRNLTVATVIGTTTITSVGTTFSESDVGRIVYLADGTTRNITNVGTNTSLATVSGSNFGTGDTNTIAIYHPYFHIDDTGRIGINTVNIANPSTQLQINGDLSAGRLTDSTLYDKLYLDLGNALEYSPSMSLFKNGSITFNAYINSGSTLPQNIDNAYPSRIFGASNGLALSVGNTSIADSYINWQDALFINGSNGYVGIGNTNPIGPLQVGVTGAGGTGPVFTIGSNGNVSIGGTGSSTYKLYVYGTSYFTGSLVSTGDGLFGGGDVYDSTGDLSVSAEDSMYFKIDYDNTLSDETRAFVFAKNTGLGSSIPAAGDELMRLTETGYLGVGASNPTSLLSVGTGTSINDTNLKIQMNTDNAEEKYMSFNKNGTYGLLVGYASNHATYGSAAIIRNVDANDSIKFFTGNTRFAMSIGNSGYIGIGTSSPNSVLSIANTSPSLELYDTTSNYWFGRMKTTNGGTWTTRGLIFQNRVNGNEADVMSLMNGNVGISTPNPGGLFQVGTADAGGTGPVFTVKNTGYVGIGTTNPLNKFQIQSAGPSTNPLSIYNSINSELFRLREDSSNNGQLSFFNSTSVAQIVLRTGNNNSYLNGGNVGIGTSNPGGLFQVGTADAGGSGPILTFLSAGTTAHLAIGSTNIVGSRRDIEIMRPNASLALTDTNSGGHKYVFTNTVTGNGSLGLYDQTATRFRWVVNSNGYMSIGITDPQVTFHVGGTLTSATGTTTVAQFDGSTTTTAGGLRIWAGNSSTDATFRISGIDSIDRDGNKRNLILNIGGSNVAIGTTNPSGLFSIQEYLRVGEISMTQIQPAATDKRFDFGALSLSGYYPGVALNNSNVASSATRVLGGSALSFWKNMGTGSSQWAHITTAPIGTAGSTIPSWNYSLNFNGSGNVAIGSSNVNIGTTVAHFVVNDNNTSTYRFAISGNSDNMYALGAWRTAWSDRNLKKNITDQSSMLSKIMQLRPVTYNWKEETFLDDITHYGLIAQEVAEVFPILVKPDRDGHLTLNKEEIPFLLIKGFQEQQNLIESLGNKLNNTVIAENGQIQVDQNISQDVLASLGYSDTKNEIENATYSITDSFGKPITSAFSAATATIAQVKAGLVNTTNLIAKNIVSETSKSKSISTAVITPLSDVTDTIIVDGNLNVAGTLTAQVASISTLYADNIISAQGSFQEIMANKIQALRAEIKNQVVGTTLMTESSNWTFDVGTSQLAINGSMSLSDNLVIGSKLIVNGQAQLGSAFITGTFTAGEIAIKDNLIETTAAALYLQPSAVGSIHLLGDTMIIADSGDVTVNGNLNLNGTLTAQTASVSGSLFANMIAADQATITNLSTTKLNVATESATIIAESGFGELATSSAQVQSNATAGTVNLPVGKTEIVITNSKLTPNSIVYLTPVGSTNNQVIYLKQKTENTFTIGLDQPLLNSIDINWWLIN